MTIVLGLEVHRAQITYDALNSATAEFDGDEFAHLLEDAAAPPRAPSR